MVDSFYWAIVRFRLGSVKGLGTYTVPDPDPGNGALKEWREKRRFTTEDRDPVSLPQLAAQDQGDLDFTVSPLFSRERLFIIINIFIFLSLSEIVMFG